MSVPERRNLTSCFFSFYFIKRRGREKEKQKRGCIMNKKICSVFIMIFIFVGIVMSILNFTAKAYALPAAIWGTTTYAESLLLASWWDLNGRHLYGNWYCVWEERNCVIVY